MIRYLLAVITMTILCTSAPVSAAQPIKIGAIVSATGPASFLGEPERNTLIMLQDQINARGGLLGRPLEVIIYDDETEVNKAVGAANRLLSRDRVVAAIGATTSGNTLAIMPRFTSAKIPLVSMAAAERIVKPINPWVFKTPQSDRHAVIKILEHARERGFKSIAIITVSDGFGQAGREVLQELLPTYGMTLVADEIYGPRDTDMTPQLTKIRGLNPDAIICWGTNPGPAVIARNRVQLGMNTPLYMSHGVASKRFIELAGEAAEGLILPAGRLTVADQLPDDHPQKALLLEYIRDYEKRFNTEVSTFGGYAYDALALIAEAITRAGEATPQAIRDNLENISGFVATGGIFNLSPEDHNGLDERAFVMVRITNGDWELVGE
ncbi:branched-chain amino acid transport system substrate-binding protein [Desulfonatronum thiosulfatophilum]|uniref:Branched-chain amino acid transport system substrate-binding protein n=1 Tax=Desulfonatronum thiosulfatophilum TaxID=617002 RepID=A0A1G6EHZ0_9BACT|nr:branched-chain amino acid transport system substrate-binding protein [Desulfonatronum thiosulfatophilum]